jgi:toxin secretion/phage lysis holin
MITASENPTTFVLEQMPIWARECMRWLQGQPTLTAMLVMMFLDWVAGVSVAIMKRKLNSSVSWRGGCKKVIMLLLVGVSAVLEPFAGGLPLTKMVSCFFLYNEALSVLENAAEAGVPLPRALVDTLAKLREGSTKDIGGGTKAPTTTIKIETPSNTPATVDVTPGVVVAPIPPK